MAGQGSYGVRIYAYGVEYKGDGRKRIKFRDGTQVIARKQLGSGSHRGLIRGWTKASARRLAFVAANCANQFGSHLTLTYRATAEVWENDAERNRRVIRRSGKDLHRFLACLRPEIGGYLWAREFQERGVVHYHVLTEREITQERASLVWCRATGQLHDPAVLRHGVMAEPIRHQQAAKKYVGAYIGKEKQKELPAGVDNAGRWWGRSRSLKLALLEEIVWLEKSEGLKRRPELQIARTLRRYIGKKFKAKFRGGMFVDWGGELTASLRRMVAELRGLFGESPKLDVLMANHGWELVEGQDVLAAQKFRIVERNLQAVCS